MRIDEVRRRNRRRAIALATVAAFNYWLIVALFVTLGVWGFAGKYGADASIGALMGAGAAIATGVVAFYVSSRLSALGPHLVHRFGAVPVDAELHPRVAGLLEELALAVGIAPVIGAVMDDPAPNALTVGTRADEMTIIVTTGLVERLTRDELEAVLAAQMCAIKRLDVLLDSVVSACVDGAINTHRSSPYEHRLDPRRALYMIVTAPTMIVAMELRDQARRRADHGADDMSVGITRNPDALVRALTKLHDDPQLVASRNSDLCDLWFEPLPYPDQRRDKVVAELAGYEMQDRIARLRPPAPQ